MESANQLINTVVNASLSPEQSTAYIFNRPFVEADKVAFAIFIIIFMIVGIAGNLLTMLVIITSINFKSIFYFFITSLCLSDILSALLSWINLYRRTWGFDYFALSNQVCVIYRAGDIWTSYVTALHILSFAFLRLFAVRWPLKVNRLTSYHGKVWIILLWLAALGATVPVAIFNGSRVRDRAGNTPDSKWPACTTLTEWVTDSQYYTYGAYTLFLYIPIIGTAIISLIIVVLLVKNRKATTHLARSQSATNTRIATERQVIVQFSLIVGSFLIGYIPFTAFEFHTYEQHNDSEATRWEDWHFGTAQYMFLRFSECSNPVFYHLGSKQLRKESKLFCSRLLSRLLPCYKHAATRSSSIAAIMVLNTFATKTSSSTDIDTK